jgi:hypothetical protein
MPTVHLTSKPSQKAAMLSDEMLQVSKTGKSQDAQAFGRPVMDIIFKRGLWLG